MDKLSVLTTTNSDGTFNTRWQWWQNINLTHEKPWLPKAGGVIALSLAPKWTEDRAILAEVCAIHHLLCIEQIHGAHRLGVNMEIEVSFGAIRKALLKGSLKKTSKGETDKQHVALFTKFLATKYFEANISVLRQDKWMDIEAQKTKNFSVLVNSVPLVSIETIAGSVSISRHALNRIVERRIAKDLIQDADDLTGVPDEKWTRAWKFLELVLPASTQVKIPTKELHRISRRYGQGTTVLWHQSSQCVFILKWEPHGLEMVTMTNDNEYNKITAGHKAPRQYGQQLVYDRA